MTQNCKYQQEIEGPLVISLSKPPLIIIQSLGTWQPQSA